jgi:hypothetical protein
MFAGLCNSAETRRHRPRFVRVLGFIAMALAFALVFGIFVQMLWNWLMPSLFKLGTITYAQAFGLMILARLVFGSCGHHRNHHHPFHRLAWRGCRTPDMANGDIRDWHHYDAWWQEQGREAFKKYSETRGQGR